MAIYKEDIVDIELESGVIHRTFLHHSIGLGDAKANRFGVRLFRNGEPEAIGTATLTALFMAPNGQNQIIDESNFSGSTTIDGNVAYVTLPPACYANEGQFCLAIKLNKSGVTTTMRIVDGMVENTGVTGATVPATQVPTSDQILAAYDAAVAMAQASVRFDTAQSLTTAQKTQARTNIDAAGMEDIAEAEALTAPEFSTSGTYAVGEYVTHNGGLYRCRSAVTTAGDWTGTGTNGNWTACPNGVAGQVKATIEEIAEAWDASKTYAAGDYVSYNRKFFRSKKDSNTEQTPEEGQWWKELGDVSNDVAHRIDTLSESVSGMETEIETMPNVKETTETEADLYICDESGNVIGKFVSGQIITKGFNSATVIGTMDTSESNADFYICDANGNVIAEFADGHIITKNFDSGDFIGIPESVSGLLTDVDALQKATTGIFYRNKDATDGVYAACRWHQPNATAKQFCLLMGGDIHGDTTRMASMVEYLNAVDAFDAGIMLGDIAGNNWASPATFYNDCIKNTERPFLTVLGNHDVGGTTPATRYTTLSELYNKFFADNIQYADLAIGEHPSGACYYYKDFSDYGIRLIVLNQYEYPADESGGTFTYTGGYICYSQDQITWFVNALKNTPSGYGVIIANHTWIGPMTVETESILTASTYSNAYAPDKCMDGYVIPDIVNAWINGESYQHSYTYTPGGSWTTLTVNADFTSRGAGEFITYIGGHWHMSILSKLYSYNTQKAYHVDCSGLSASTQGDTPRRAGTRSEDAICALAVDRTNRQVKIFRIGAHFTKDAVNRLYGKYAY